MSPKLSRRLGKKGDDKKLPPTVAKEVVIDQNFKPVKETFFRNVFMKSEGEIIYHVTKRLLYGFVTEKGEGLYSEKDVIIDAQNFVFFKGDIPIMLVAHADTVHAVLPSQIYEHKTEKYFVAKEGLGADDRAGIAAILYIIYKGYKPYVLITRGEETGAHGAKAAAKFLKDEVKNVRCMIELDRRGSKDAVYYDNDNKEFSKWVESFGFVKDIGSFSDISVLMSAWNISGVNLSIGYYGAHSKFETLKIVEFFSTVDKVMNILDNPPEKKYEFVEESFYWGFETKSVKPVKKKTKVKDKVFERVLNCFRSMNAALKGISFVSFYFEDKIPAFNMLDSKDETEFPVTELLKKNKLLTYTTKKGDVKNVFESIPENIRFASRKCVDLLVSMSTVDGFYEDFKEYAKKNGTDIFNFDEDEEEVIGDSCLSGFELPVPDFIRNEADSDLMDEEDVLEACIAILEDYFPDYQIDVNDLTVYTADGGTMTLERLRRAIERSPDFTKEAKSDLMEAINYLTSFAAW